MLKGKLISIAREFVPPIAVRIRRSVAARLRGAATGQGSEQSAEFYDRMFLENAHWRAHYSESQYYPIWTVLADRIVRAGSTSILDIGCGSGQVAALLHDKGIRRYLGIDFSVERTNHARKVCPTFEFVNADIFATDLLKTRDYDCVVCTEFLEHVDRDLDVLDLLRGGTRCIATVPNFGGLQHVRFFRDCDEVAARYASKFDEFQVTEHVANAKGTRFFILEGVTKLRTARG